MSFQLPGWIDVYLRDPNLGNPDNPSATLEIRYDTGLQIQVQMHEMGKCHSDLMRDNGCHIWVI